MTGFMPGCPLVGECHGGVAFTKDFCNSIHQFGELLRVLWGKILPESRVQSPASFDFFPRDGRHHAHQLDFGSRRPLGFRWRRWVAGRRTLYWSLGWPY